MSCSAVNCQDGCFEEEEEFNREAVPVTVEGSDDLQPSGDELDVEAATGKPGSKELEWDDSTLSY